MSIGTRSLIALAVCGAAVATISHVAAAGATDSPFELDCGASGTSTPGAVVVQILDHGVRQHGRLTVAPERDPDPGYIGITSSVAGGHTSCETIAGGHLHLRGTTATLNRSTLRVVAEKPVPLEVRDASGALLSRSLVDPASGKQATLTW